MRFAIAAILVLPAVGPALGEAGSAEKHPEFVFSVARDGRATATILVAREDIYYTPALNDVRGYVERICGAKLEVVEGTRDLPGPTLHVGETEYHSRMGAVRAAIRGDGFVLALCGEDLLVAGNVPQGTANGLWTILQDQFGVRWYWDGPLWEVVPEKEALEIRVAPNAAAGAYVENPSYYGRFYWGAPPSQTYGRRMRLTQPGTSLPYVGTGHALDRVVPLEKFAMTHPDYFAWIDGRRITDRVTHPCFTHPDMFGVFMEYVRAGGTTFGINDNLDACRCPRCLAVDGASEPYMGMWNLSESYFQLIARVARQTAEELPGRRLGVFAYQLTNAPPRTVDHIGENVDVVLCQDTSQHFDPEVRRTDRRMSAEWVEKAGGVSLYDYYGINYWTPRYFPSLLAGQLEHLARCRGLGYMTHGTTMIDSSMPMFYLYCRLLWDAGLDPKEVIEEMLQDLYADASGPIRAFYEHWERCWMRQKKGKWFRGMDDFRAETSIYTPEDIEKGWVYLEEAAALARQDRVRQRIEFLRSCFAFTRAAARAHTVSMRAITDPPPPGPETAREISDRVVLAWRDFAAQLGRSEEIPGTSASGWHSKTFRVRAWALKQQMRDAALAPLVRWACSQEGTMDPRALRSAEHELARAAVANREAIEGLVTESIGAVRKPPRADPLCVADIPRVEPGPPIAAGPDDWPDVRRIGKLPWVFRRPPPDYRCGKYDEPMPQHVVPPPEGRDQSITWQAAWDAKNLYLRIVVTDDRHVQNQPPAASTRDDCLQVTLNARRQDFGGYDEHSWYFLMGDYQRKKPGFVVALRSGKAEVHIVTPPPLAEPVDASGLLKAAVARRASRTVYEMAIDWRWLPGFEPRPERSFGISIVVSDRDDGTRRTAEYGDGIFPRRRPTEFAALRLVEG